MPNVAPDVLDDEQGDVMKMLPLSKIHIKPNFNPRIHFPDDYINELAESIKQIGVITPISVRPIPGSSDEYWVTVGECRTRASNRIGLDLIPCVIKNITEQQALAMAVAENDKRKDTSPAEDAMSAQRLLDACGNDKDEVLRLTGWSVKKLNGRLLLLHAHDDVLVALAEGKILLGHVELLATMPKESQIVGLKKIIDHKVPVSELKKQLAQFTQDLGKAIFDIQLCQGCEFNSTTQFGLFDQSVGEGRCSNSVCWKEKTDCALAEKRKTLSEDHNVVFLRSEKPTDKVTVLFKAGTVGVGDEQFSLCHQCANFGILLENSPGKAGEIQEDCCFDVKCNQEKVKQYNDSLATVARKSGTKETKSPSQKSVKTSSKAKGSGNNVALIPKRVYDFVDVCIRQHAAEIAQNTQHLAKVVTAYALFEAAGKPESAKINKDRSTAYTQLFKLKDEDIEVFMIKLLANIFYQPTARFESSSVIDAAILIDEKGTPASDYFAFTRDFAEKPTKTILKSMLSEPHKGESFCEWYNTKESDPAAFNKLFNMPNKEILNRVFPEKDGFDFSGFVPSSVCQYIEQTVNSAKEDK